MFMNPQAQGARQQIRGEQTEAAERRLAQGQGEQVGLAFLGVHMLQKMRDGWE
jgi:hypothetical protein